MLWQAGAGQPMYDYEMSMCRLVILLLLASSAASLQPQQQAHPSHAVYAQSAAEEENGSGRYVIEGRIFPPEVEEISNWQVETRVHVNGGEFIGLIREDGSFAVHNVPSGSYIVEVVNPDYMYEPVRVEINSKGKFRARKVNFVQTSQVIQVPYPLRMKALAKFRYFQVREQWRLTDFLFNPMVIMMVLPLLLIMLLPKMMNDPETKKEMEQISNFTKMSDMPEVSEMITSFFSGGPAPKQNTKATKQLKKRQ